MPYLIDGHNLIPKIPGLSLRAIDDETQLISLLQEYCRRQRKEADVFFDNAPPGNARSHSYGAVTARFVRQGTTADSAIHDRLNRLGREARNWSVVSSDHAVQAAARASRAQVISSETFAAQLRASLESVKNSGAGGEVKLSQDEIDEWLSLFGANEE
jgi:uncharacterized protein